MKTKFLVFLCVLLTTGFVACNDDDDDVDNRIYFYEEPVVAKTVNGSIVFDTQYGVISAPVMNGKVSNDSYLVAFFFVDPNVTPATLSEKRGYFPMGADTALVSNVNPMDEYNDSIAEFKLFLKNKSLTDFICVDSTFFAMIRPQTNKDKKFEYVFYTPPGEVTDGIQTAYIRSKKLDENSSYFGDAKIPFAFNFSSLLMSNPDPTKKTIKFNLKYKTGKNSDGSDKYADYQNNPVTLTYAP